MQKAVENKEKFPGGRSSGKRACVSARGSAARDNGGSGFDRDCHAAGARPADRVCAPRAAGSGSVIAGLMRARGSAGKARAEAQDCAVVAGRFDAAPQGIRGRATRCGCSRHGDVGAAGGAGLGGNAS